MPVLHCAKCGSRLEIFKSGGIWTVRCITCNVELTLDGRTHDLFDAYDAFTKDILSGKIPKSTKRARAKQQVRVSDTRHRQRGNDLSRVETLPVIRKKLKDGGRELDDLPSSLKNLLTRGRDYLVCYKYMPPTNAEYGCCITDLPLPPRLKEFLQSQGIVQLYAFQEKAIRQILSGRNVVISAPTGQGKTEAFILPIIIKLVEQIQEAFFNPGVRALLVYPTKALARDQCEKIVQMCKSANLTVGIFDGDVSSSQREKLYRAPPDILLTNPDVLNYHLGWNRSRLVPLLQTVKYVVLDEIHLYTGSMGANVYYILKRLELETGPFQKIGASATIANPKEFAEVLFDDEVVLIESKNARRGPIHFIMYYPGERTKYSMIVEIVRNLLRGGFKILVFGNTHTEAELLNVLLQEQGIHSMVHRSGLPRQYRRTVEDRFRTGELPVIVSTPTLELGIDIGDLNCVVSMLVSVTRLTQRIGRAGRKGQESVAILALRDRDPISSFYRYKPNKYFTDIDAAYMEPGNEVVGYYQIIAAALSGKLNQEMFPFQNKILKQLEKEGIISIEENGHVRVADYSAAMKKWRSYSIRGIGDSVQIRTGSQQIGERSMPMAAQELHPGAVYLHGGKQYLCLDFKYAQGFGQATVVPFNDRSVYTRALYTLMPRILEVHEKRKILGMQVVYCTLEMEQSVYGYVKLETRTGKSRGFEHLDTPIDYKFLTRGFAFRAPSPTQTVSDYLDGKLKDADGAVLGPGELYSGAFHALEHVLIESSDMLTGGSTREIGGVSMGDSGVIFVYDGSPGGNGASKLLFTRLPEAFSRARTILENCDCKTVDGCPLCTYSYQCGNNNQPLFKLGALDSIHQILQKNETTLETTSHIGYEPLV